MHKLFIICAVLVIVGGSVLTFGGHHPALAATTPRNCGALLIHIDGTHHSLSCLSRTTPGITPNSVIFGCNASGIKLEIYGTDDTNPNRHWDCFSGTNYTGLGFIGDIY